MLGSYPEALAAGGLAGGAGGPAEGGPAVLGAPGQGHAGVPGGAVGAGPVEVPVDLLGAVEVVGGAHVGRRLRRRHGRRGAQQHRRQRHTSSGHRRHRRGCVCSGQWQLSSD